MRLLKLLGCAFLVPLFLAPPADAGGAGYSDPIAGIRITQTGNTGLMLNVDVTAFYTTGTTETTVYLGTYYNGLPAIDWGDGSTVPAYGYGSSTGIPLAATSTVVNGTPVRSYRGSFSHTYGTPGSYTVQAHTNCCVSSTFTPVTGSVVTTSFTTVTYFGTTTTTSATVIRNSLSVVAAAPGFSKAFGTDPIGVGLPSTLTFTIDNTASTLDDNALDFTDNLPAGLVVASPANVVNTCTGGTVTAVSGSAVIGYTGGTVTAGATCTVSVDTTSVLPAVYNNTSGDLTSTFGNSGTAADSLTVTAAPPGFSKAFAPSSVGVGVPSTVTFTIDNSVNAAGATALNFSDTFPAGLIVASPANSVNTCTGGTLTAVSGSGSVSYTGGTVAATATCMLSVDVVSLLPGIFANTTGDLTSSFLNSGTASDTLTVTAMPPAFSKAFAPNPVDAGLPSTLTFTIDNTANAANANALDFTDTLPAGLTVASPANPVNTCIGGTLTAAAGAGVISYTGGAVAASATCALSVDVVSLVPGNYVNTSGELTSTFGNSGTADDTLTVTATPPAFSKVFVPDTLGVITPSALTFTIDNTASAALASALDFTDTLPAGLTVATPSNASTTCTGGTLTATSGTATVSYTGGSVAAGATCTVRVDVRAGSIGVFNNTSGDLTSSLGNSGTASDTLTVIDPPVFSKAFAPDFVGTGISSTLTFTVDNSANPIAATALDFVDNLPANVVVATPANASATCTGGTLTANSGDTSITYTGGTAAASTTCILSVDVSSATPGVYINTTSDLTSSIGNSGTASDTLTVNPQPLFTKSFFPISVPETGGVSTLTFLIDNTASTVDATGLTFTDNLPAGMTVNNPPNAVETCGGGTVTAVNGTAVIDYTSGSVAAGATCTVSVDLFVFGSGPFVNIADPLSSNLGISAAGGPATATLFTVPNVLEIPTMSDYGLVLLAALLGLLGFAAVRRMR